MLQSEALELLKSNACDVHLRFVGRDEGEDQGRGEEVSNEINDGCGAGDVLSNIYTIKKVETPH